LYQQGTFGPADGLHRWMPSIAMNGAGDIGIGYMVSSTSTFVSTAAAGQTAAASGTGTLDSSELICAAGTGVQTSVNRAGDYAATSVDPVTDSFWHTNEVFTQTGQYQWNTFICEFTVSGGGGNIPPTASFTYSCDDNTRICNFDASGSSDADGTIVSYDWDFGDTATGSGVTTSHTYGSYGDFTVVLTVTDDGNATDTDTQTVTLTDPNQPNITLSVNGYKVKGVHTVDLTWSGATGTNVDIYRNSSPLTTTANDGAYTDSTGNKGGGASYTYQVCEAGTSNCSNTATASF
jgi:hypothetical protein